MDRRAPLLAAALALGCGTKDEGPRANLSADQAASMRQACAFTAGQTAGLTLAKDAPLGDQIPIDTVVIIMMENRSVDHVLGLLPSNGQPDFDVASPTVTNPDSKGNPVQRFHMSQYCFADTNHEFEASHTQFDDGMNDGFVITNETSTVDGTRAMGYYDATDIPWLYAAASTWATSDRHFASVMGPTFPNREYLYAATSFGTTDNMIFSTGSQQNIMTIVDDFNAKNKASPVSWHVYYEGVPNIAIFIDTLSSHLDNVSLFKSFAADAAAGMLANIVFVDPNTRDEWGGGDDDHPPGDPQMGDTFLAGVVQTLQASPQWPHMAIIITFDEHGGLYDHVAPPKGCAPDALLPMVPAGQPQHDFAQLGFRVPLIVISPYAKAHYVSHKVTDHTSIIRFVEQRFKLPAMSARDANADPLSDLFDFSKPAQLKPPSLPTPPVDQQKLMDCEQQFPLKATNFFPDMGAPPDMS
jgi:phospholipase C